MWSPPDIKLPRSFGRRAFFLAGGLVLAAVVYLFIYNSGFGYDTLEYLVLGRYVARGGSLYNYFPSKSPGIFYFVALLIELGVPLNHMTLSFVIEGQVLFSGFAVYAVSRTFLPQSVSQASGALTILAALFMELNFLETEGFVVLCGLAAFAHFLVYMEKQRKARSLVAAGFWLALGVCFKSAAFFYGLAFEIFLLLRVARRKISIKEFLKENLLIGVGFVLLSAPIAAFFAAHGHLGDFIECTWTFPLFQYPANTTYLAKLYTKLAWIHLFVLSSFSLLCMARVRHYVVNSTPLLLSLLFGLCSYLALLKTQSSHYAFAGAPFLLIFACAVYAKIFEGRCRNIRHVATGAALAGVLGVISILSYRPEAIARVIQLKNFKKAERPQAAFIDAHVAPDAFVLMTSQWSTTFSYWVADRLPPPPFVTSNVQTIWFLRHDLERVFAALDNPKLVLVDFDPGQPAHPQLEGEFGDEPGDREIMKRYLQEIEARFTQLPKTFEGRIYWVRKVAVQRR